MNLVDELFKLNNELTQSIKLLRKNGEQLAKAEREYKLKLRTEALRLRQEENLAVTLIDLIIYGVPVVAELRFKRDVAKATYDANQEHINCCKLQIRLLESQISREFEGAGKNGL